MRPLIQAFAEAMEAKLASNDAVKGEWRDEPTMPLLRALRGEVTELADAISAYYLGQSADVVLAEAADVALYALMIADVCGALPETTNRGRTSALTFAPGTVRMASPLCQTQEVW